MLCGLMSTTGVFVRLERVRTTGVYILWGPWCGAAGWGEILPGMAMSLRLESMGHLTLVLTDTSPLAIVLASGRNFQHDRRRKSMKSERESRRCVCSL